MSDPRLKIVKPSGPQCMRCGMYVPMHHVACPKTPEDVEVWQAGYEASADGDNCYAEVGTTFWLGWMMQMLLAETRKAIGWNE